MQCQRVVSAMEYSDQTAPEGASASVRHISVCLNFRMFITIILGT